MAIDKITWFTIEFACSPSHPQHNDNDPLDNNSKVLLP